MCCVHDDRTRMRPASYKWQTKAFTNNREQSQLRQAQQETLIPKAKSTFWESAKCNSLWAPMVGRHLEQQERTTSECNLVCGQTVTTRTMLWHNSSPTDCPLFPFQNSNNSVRCEVLFCIVSWSIDDIDCTLYSILEKELFGEYILCMQGIQSVSMFIVLTLSIGGKHSKVFQLNLYSNPFQSWELTFDQKFHFDSIHSHRVVDSAHKQSTVGWLHIANEQWTVHLDQPTARFGQPVLGECHRGRVSVLLRLCWILFARVHFELGHQQPYDSFGATLKYYIFTGSIGHWCTGGR